jgi:hypothetical protein
MKRFLLVTVFAAALCAGYASSALFAGIYGSWCDPDTLTNGCPMTCGGGVNNVCALLGPCTYIGGAATPLRNFCVDFPFQSCAVKPCPVQYTCGGAAGGVPCLCPEPPGSF